MVSGTCCPAWSTELIRRVESRGELLHEFSPERADFRPKRADTKPGRGNFRSWGAYFGPERVDLRPERTDLKLQQIDSRPQVAGLRIWALGGGALLKKRITQ